MAEPTKAEIFVQWANAIKLLDETYRYGSVNATNFIGLLDTLQQSFEGDFLDEAERAAQSLRSALAGSVTQQSAADIQRPFLRQFMLTVAARKDVLAASDEEMLSEMYRFFIDNNDRVQSRVFTFGSPSAAAANIGTSNLVRLNKDRFNYDIESQHIDSKRVRCILDHNTGTQKGNEVWQIEGQSLGRDELQFSGSGIIGTLTGLTVDDSVLSNAGFQNFAGTAALPTAITDWASSGGDSSAVYTFDSTNVFREGPSDGATSFSLNVVATTILTQKLDDIGADLDRATPYALATIWNAEIGTATGTLVTRMGNVQNSVTVDALTGWNVTITPGVQDWAHWYDVFAEDEVQIDVDWTETGGTGLRIAEVLLVPGTFFNGSFYWMLPSTAANYIAPRVDDEFSFADIASESINQQWVFRGFGAYMPHTNGSSVTWSDA